MDRRLWGLDVNGGDHLVANGCDLVSLAAIYGTPLHVLDEDRLRDNYRRVVAAFRAAHRETRVFYSYKTNCIPAALALLHAEGCGAEVVSPYEAWVARALRVDGANVVYNGVARSVDDFRTAIEQDVGLINVDSLGELHAVTRAAEDLRRPVNVGVRVSLAVGWRAHFGLHPAADGLLGRVADLKRHRYVTLQALHAHVGTALRETATHERVIAALCALRREMAERSGIAVPCLGVGGGFGVPGVKTLTLREAALYRLWSVPPRPPRPDDCPSIETFGRAVTEALREHGSRSGLDDPVLYLEPGRAITSDAQLLLVTVKDVKARGAGPGFAVTDGSMQGIAFPLAYEYHHAFVASRASAPFDRRYSVTGPLCSPEDLLYRNWRLPALSVGDVLAVMDTGAYFTSFANNFSYPRPAVVGISAGRHRVLRARETFAQMTMVDGLDATRFRPA
jgi:diaminopimelate decarboxylase